MHDYWLAGASGTIHVTPTCHSARRSAALVHVISPNPPMLVWDLLWHNHHTQAGVLDPSELEYGTEQLPVLGDAYQPVGETRVGVEQDGYGVRRWGCLHCLEGKAIADGWVNTWPPDPNRRHR